MDLLGRYTKSRHDTAPVVGRYSWARHGVSGALAKIPRFVSDLLARVLVSIGLDGRTVSVEALTGRVPATVLTGRTPVFTALTGRSIPTTALLGRMGEC